MINSLIFSFSEEMPLAHNMAAHLQCEMGAWEWHNFPDGESLVRIDSTVQGKQAVIVCSLHKPDSRFLALCFLADTLKELGASRVTLVAPYLAYMRQDKRFHAGEAVTSRSFARMLSTHIDYLITVDPHLHRYHSLDEIYSVPSTVVHAAADIAAWIAAEVENPLIIGPDEESRQWVADVATQAGAAHTVLAKERKGDRDVQITMTEKVDFSGHTAVLVDDIISSAHTMAEAAKIITPHAPVLAVGVHGIFAGNGEQLLRDAGISRIITCNSIAHTSNAIDLSSSLAAAVKGAYR